MAAENSNLAGAGGIQGEIGRADALATKPSLEWLKPLLGKVKPAAEHFASQESGSKPSRVPRDLSELLPGAERLVWNEQSCHRVMSRVALDGRRTKEGYSCPAARFKADDNWGEALAILARDPAWREVDPGRIAFIDVETTSLAGGSGTYVFLIGVGRFTKTQEGRAFAVHQYFMEDYADEEALVEAVSAELSDDQGIVSYNGKCFDLPLMETRWRMCRRKPRFPRLHLDLLHNARRLWKRRLPDCRLGTIEREILGIHRVSDVESASIPFIYFDYLRGVRRERILPVFDHHAQDVLSMGALLRAMIHALGEPGDPLFNHASDQWGLSQIFHHAGRDIESLARLERAIGAAGCFTGSAERRGGEISHDAEFAFRLSMRLAKRFMQSGRENEALAIWRDHARPGLASRPDPFVELAKHAEHRMKDHAEAARWAELALDEARKSPAASALAGVAGNSSSRTKEIEAIERRLARVRSKAVG